MRTRLNAALGLLTAALVWSASPAHGQVASYVDESGKRVFVNADPPARPQVALAKRTPAVRPAATPAAAPARSGSSSSPSREALGQLAHATAEQHEIDPALVRAIIEAESNWNPTAVSSKGALGLMQLIPATADRFGVQNAFDPEQNLSGGVRYLRMLLERYNGDLDRTLAAYNAGEGAVERAGGIPNYAETRAYVQKVTDSYFRPGSGRRPMWWNVKRPIYRAVDERGRVVFTNE
jgi:soluble lytic murein transglycosylase-like protein